MIMPTNKKAQLRYKVLDRCFSDFHHRYEINDLLCKVNEALTDLYGINISIRQIRDDIKYMRDRLTFNAPIKAYQYDGKKCYYRYEDRGFSIFNNDLSVDEVSTLRSTIDMLGRFRGVPSNAWLEEVISNLEYRFGVKSNTENVVAFDQNELLKGLEFLGELIDSAMNHQPLSVLYRTFEGNERLSIIHPYHVKQFNNRWFLIGLQEGNHGNYITNKALDRIVKFSRANVNFIPNQIIDFTEYFNDVIGVTIPKEHPTVEKVVLKFAPARFPYVVNKPIHSSQIILDECNCLIQLLVRPNKELEARIFSYGNQVEVIKPLWLREQIIKKFSEIVKIYRTGQKDCTDNL